MEQTIPEINQKVTFQPWSAAIKEKLIPILVDSHFNYSHPDGYVFCHYIGIEGCHRFIKDMEANMFGIFLAEHSYGCFLDDRLIGGITFLNREGNGYISEIVVDSPLQGQHLGKSILFKAIKKWFECNSESQQVDLDVTLKNQNAHHLYKSLGFQEGEHYVFYCWVDPTNQTIV
jgi:GNAT superfamily N-acetyltransferase